MDDRILENINTNHRDLVSRVEDLMRVLREHIDAPGHAGHEGRIKALEDELHTQKARPIQTWQIISGIIALICTFCFLGLSTLSDVLSLIMFIRSLH